MVMRISRTQIDIKLIETHVKILLETSKTLSALAEEAAPQKLTPEQQKEITKYNSWLKTSSNKLSELAKIGQALLRSKTLLMQGTKEMQEMQNRFNLEYLQLQQDMQAQNRQFTLVSNIMKVKHDTAKAAINNVR